MLTDFAKLETFLTVVREKSFSKASAKPEPTFAIKEDEINSSVSTATVPKMSQAMSRRDLIRGKFLRS